MTNSYPCIRVLNFTYNAMGALNSLSGTTSYVTNIDYNPSGQVTETYLNNGVVSQSCYDLNTQRLIQIRAYPGALVSCTNTSPSNPRLNLSYQYYPNGNVKQISDATRNEVNSYTYDSLDRLKSVATAQNGATLFQRGYDYDPIGNITRVGAWPTSPSSATNFGALGGASVASGNRGRITSFASANGSISSFIRGALSPAQPYWQYTDYTYGNSAHKHAVTGLSTGESYGYDANGNMTARTEGGSTYTQNFDVENRLASVVVSTQTTTFVYDGDGALIKKVNPDGTSPSVSC